MMTRYLSRIAKFLWFIVILLPSVASNGRQTLATSAANGKKPKVPPDLTITTQSSSQCMVLCNLKSDDCKSMGYHNKKCDIFKELYTDLVEADGYNYFETKPTNEPETTTLTVQTTTSRASKPDTTTLTVETTTTPVATASLEYTVYTNACTYAAASDDCKSKGGKLACIHDADTNTKIIKLISKYPKLKDGIWIGLRARTTSGPFVWTDGVEISPSKQGYWHNWLTKDPDDYKNNIEHSCVRILSDESNKDYYTKWADTKTCDSKHPYICEVETST